VSALVPSAFSCDRWEAVEASTSTRVLVVANRTAATPLLLQEVERRRGGEFALIVPTFGGRGGADWSADDAARRLEQAAGRPVERLAGDSFAAIERAVHAGRFDEILVSVSPGRRWPRRDLVARIDALGVPVSAMIPGRQPAADQTVIRVHWGD
jgi:hypothetical protein